MEPERLRILKKIRYKGIYPLPHHSEEDCSNRVKSHQKLLFLIFTNISHITKWTLLILKIPYFFQNFFDG